MIGERSRWSCRRYRRRQKRETGTTSALSWHPAQAERAAAVTGHQSATRLPPPQQNGVTANRNIKQLRRLKNSNDIQRRKRNMVRKRTKSRLICLSISILLAALIVMSFALTLVGGNEIADSAVINNADTIATDLLMDKATRGTTVNSTVFNGNALSALYEKLAGTGADFNTVATKARATKSTYSNTSVTSMHSGMDSGEIRTANGGRNIVVKLDGKEWIVTALTTKDTSSTSDVILTLMLKDVAYNSKWGDWYPSSSTDWSMTYPATMYSRSYIRAGLLNNGAQYTTNGSNLMNFTHASGLGTGAYPFGIYTDNTEQGHITNFLVKPNEVLYQQYENLRATATSVGNNWYQAQNEIQSMTWQSMAQQRNSSSAEQNQLLRLGQRFDMVAVLVGDRTECKKRSSSKRRLVESGCEPERNIRRICFLAAFRRY